MDDQKTKVAVKTMGVSESRKPSDSMQEIQQKIEGSTGTVFHSRVFNLVRVPIDRGNGKPDYFDIIDSVSGTRILIVVKDQDGEEYIVLVRQSRPKVDDGENWGRKTLELPGGAVEKGELAVNNALKEVLEEAGVKAESAVPVYPGNTKGNLKDAGQGPGVIYFFKAEGKTTIGKSDPETTEGKIDVVFVTLPQAMRMIETGEISDLLTLPPIQDYIIKKQADRIRDLEMQLTKLHRD